MVARAKLIGWGPRVLYLGPAFGLTPHRNATAVLAVALDGKLEVAGDPAKPDGAWRSARSVLIPPNTLHHLRMAGGPMAFLYVDPLSRDLAALKARMQDVSPRAAFDLIGEAAVIGVLTRLAEGRIADGDGRKALMELLGIGVRADPDVRILSALRRMRDQPCRSHSMAELGACAGLSASRFLHLFKAETGVPLRRYRLWNRMGAAVAAFQDGMSLTEAAHAAGFASSAHFSTAFRDMFGMMPSELLKGLEAAQR
ncbi:AraC family transcriptional regulator [Bradyrhizobium sediminis]|uniref:AraC family transcriptional regulator n=1 Tax=Bradyrhizobium sediminis TaxID=2840469 RepID=A0A975NL80_9BRAD|nr:AraC family transcriptional regulator [Bradyrhizobium sediminis]QWG16566.1 AraC family transcriptional regulator [Bradyrhizobium sediminis]